MAKIDALGQLASLENQTSAIQTINENADKIESAFGNTLSRDGSGPNQMLAPLDMNSQRILNLPTPTSDNDPARWVDLKQAFALTGEIVIPSMIGNEGKFLVTDGTTLEWQAATDISGLGDMKGSNNLSELTNVPQARTNLGLGTVVTYNVGTSGGQVPLLNTDNTFSGNNNFSGANNVSGVMSVTGAGDVVLNNTGSPLNVRSAGYRGAPVVTRNSSFTWAAEDSGLTQLHTDASTYTYTLPPSFLPEGHFVAVTNIGSGAVAVNRGSGVAIRKLGSGENANLTVNQWGMLVLYQYSLNNWLLLSAVNVV